MIGEYLNASPYLGFILVFTSICGMIRILSWPFLILGRWIRHKNIKAHGWPPPHLDADGDTIE